MLKQNGVLLNQMPLKLRGFDLGSRYQFGMTRSWFFGEHLPDKNSGFPDGNNTSQTWFPAIYQNGMNARNSAALTITQSGSGALGLNGDGASTAVFSVTGDGQLITSGSGSASFVFSQSANLLAVLNGSGSANAVISASATVSALGFINAASAINLSGSLVSYAVGNMVGSTIDTTILTADTIANAIGSHVVEAGYTLDQVLRLLAAHAAGAATGLEGPTPQFKGLDGTTVRIDGTYSGGTRGITTLRAT